MNTVIAKINASYQDVSRKGTLYYYKDLFDLRYLYKLDPEYGYLVGGEHPFSLLLLPTLCCLKYFVRKKLRRQNQALSHAILRPN